MTSSNVETKTLAATWFERVSALLIGTVAVLAAVLAVEQSIQSYAGDRAQQEASRLAADASAKVSATSLEGAFEPRALQDSIVLALEGLNRQITALPAGDEAQSAVGTAQVNASDRLSAAVSDSARTATGDVVDAYLRGLLATTTDALVAEVAEQNRQVDLANDAGNRSGRAVLGLSFAALAGVMIGLAAVLRSGAAGWTTLIAALAVVALAGVAAVTVITG